MVEVIIACLLLALGAWGCDDGGGGMIVPTPTPTPTPGCRVPGEDIIFFDGFLECPTDGLAQVCENRGYFCNFFKEEDPPLGRPDLNGFLSPQGLILNGEIIDEPCIYIDCFTMECDTTVEIDNTDVFTNRMAVFSDIVPLGGFGGFAATADVEEFGVFNFVECSILVP